MVEMEGSKQLLGQLPLRPGQSRWYEGGDYRQDGVVRVNLALSWKGKEPWYLVTNLGDLGSALALYRRRMAIEEFFRECKGGLGLGQAQVRQAHRLDGLLMGLVVAYLLLALWGLNRAIRGFKGLVLTRGKASFCWLALQWLKRPPPNAGRLLQHILGVQSG